MLTLKLGSLKSPRGAQSGQVLSMDWLPEKPHNIIAIGFYDGMNPFLFDELFRCLKDRNKQLLCLFRCCRSLGSLLEVGAATSAGARRVAEPPAVPMLPGS